MSRRLVASLAFVLGLVLSAPAHAARVPVLVIAFNGQPADSTDRQAVLQAFEAALDADSLALIELVEALEEELGERSVGFRIEDEDLVDLKTVRDAVDYVFERVEGA